MPPRPLSPPQIRRLRYSLIVLLLGLTNRLSHYLIPPPPPPTTLAKVITNPFALLRAIVYYAIRNNQHIRPCLQVPSIHVGQYYFPGTAFTRLWMVGDIPQFGGLRQLFPAALQARRVMELHMDNEDAWAWGREMFDVWPVPVARGGDEMGEELRQVIVRRWKDWVDGYCRRVVYVKRWIGG